MRHPHGLPDHRGTPRLYQALTPGPMQQPREVKPPVSSPYTDLPSSAFWRSAVAGRAPLDPGAPYTPRFAIDRKTRIVTAGSCFAQHVGAALKSADFRVLDAEPGPIDLPDTVMSRFGYGLYSARYGNIYSARHLWQLWQEADGSLTPADPVWERDGRFFDTQRPGVEPDGLPSPNSVALHRQRHLARVRHIFSCADLFVFTFGLTEAWANREDGSLYATAPGTIAGEYDPARHVFRNFEYPEVLKDFCAFRRAMTKLNPAMKFLVTVSPVPLTATASGHHVEVATAYSKAVLRAVCGALCARFDNVDYFPSYEIMTAQHARGAYYEANMRTVARQGVATAMRCFFDAHGVTPPATQSPVPTSPPRTAEDVQCDDALLEAFAP